jgi:hypothetical protein
VAMLEHCLIVGGQERIRLQLLLETRGGRTEELDVQVLCKLAASQLSPYVPVASFPAALHSCMHAALKYALFLVFLAPCMSFVDGVTLGTGLCNNAQPKRMSLAAV